MGRHLADHRTPSHGGRLKHFLRIARDGGAAWQALWRKPVPAPVTNRRTVEFLRIEKGREV